MNFLSNKSTSCKRCALAREETALLEHSSRSSPRLESSVKRAQRGQERCAIDSYKRVSV